MQENKKSACIFFCVVLFLLDMNLLELIDQEGVKEDVTPFKVGDTVRVHFKIVEGNKERVQVYEGIVIARKNGGVRETFTVRKISFGVGVERVFPVHSPRIEKIEVVRVGAVRRAKLYYIRELTGKDSTRVKEAKKVDKKTAEKKSPSKRSVKAVEPIAEKDAPKTEVKK